MKAPAILLLLAAGLLTADLAHAASATGVAPVSPAATSALTPSWAEPLGCGSLANDTLSLLPPAGLPMATDMCGSCNILLCKNVPLNAGCTIGNHRGHCVPLANKCSDNVTWQCDCRLPG